MLEILSKGLQSTVQDMGRRGHLSRGVGPCGAMDKDALAYANLLAGNDVNTACIEMAGMGITARFDEKNIFALCGGIFDLRLDGQSIECGRAYTAQKGSVLEIGRAVKGFRTYLAVAGGFGLPQVLGSLSTDVKAKIGGYQGRALIPGDKLPFAAPNLWLPHMERRAFTYDLRENTAIRLVAGAEYESFTPDSLNSFFTGEYTVTPQSDRMGFRLSGAQIEYKDGFGPNIISGGIAPGAIQVPDGQPIIMMADAQTVGGYSKIGAVISTDLPALAQKKPGDSVRFEEITIEQAQSLYLRRLRKLAKLEEELNYPTWLEE